MPVVDIGKVRVRVRDGRMPMRVNMWLYSVPLEIVCVLMMFIMSVPMIVFERLVRVLVHVTLTQMQPDAERHQHRRDPERQRRLFGPQRKRDRDAK